MKLSKTFAVLALLPLMACGQGTSTGTSASQPQTGKSLKATAKNSAPSAVTKKITEKLQAAYSKEKLSILSVSTTPVQGLYEVVATGNQVIYTDENADYMLVGDLIDIKTRTSLTEERKADLNRVDFAGLPFDMAIKEVRGNGKLKVAVFSDPDCPFCKRLEREFEQMTDITIYTFLMPIDSLHPEARKKSVQIWCQKDRTAAWTTWMRQGKFPPAVPECENPVNETTSLGEQLGFYGTPAIVFPNGKVQSGYSPKAQLQSAIEANQKK